MFLGKFLVDQNKVSEEKLVEALCLQIESTPSLLRLAIDHKVINAQEAIGIVDKSISAKKHFYDILKDEKPDKISEIEQLLSAQAEARRGLGEFLAQSDSLEIDEYEKLLTEYFVDRPADEVASSTTSAPEISSVALEALRELEGMGNTEEIAELESRAGVSSETKANKGKDNQFVKTYTDERNIEIKNYGELLSTTGEVELLDDFEKFYHTLVGICRFENMNLLERFLCDLELYIVKARKKWGDDKVRKIVIENFLLSITLLWDMRTAIFETGREVEAFSRPPLKLKYREVTKNLSGVL